MKATALGSYLLYTQGRRTSPRPGSAGGRHRWARPGADADWTVDGVGRRVHARSVGGQKLHWRAGPARRSAARARRSASPRRRAARSSRSPRSTSSGAPSTRGVAVGLGRRPARRAHALDGLRVPRRQGALRQAVGPLRHHRGARRLPRPLRAGHRRATCSRPRSAGRRRTTPTAGRRSATGPTTPRPPTRRPTTSGSSGRGAAACGCSSTSTSTTPRCARSIPLKSEGQKCNEMDTVRLEMQRLHELQDYVDAQAGGPGQGLLPDRHQRRSRPGGSSPRASSRSSRGSRSPSCSTARSTTASRTATSDKVDRTSTRSTAPASAGMELVNKFDNAFVGVAGDNGTQGVIVNNGNKLETGRYWDMQTCQGPAGRRAGQGPDHARPGGDAAGRSRRS